MNLVLGDGASRLSPKGSSQCMSVPRQPVGHLSTKGREDSCMPFISLYLTPFSPEGMMVTDLIPLCTQWSRNPEKASDMSKVTQETEVSGAGLDCCS